MKKCTKCGIEKPLTDFFSRGESNKKHISRSSCKSCCKLLQETYRANNREAALARQKFWRDKNTEHRRNYYFVSLYGITSDQRDEMLLKQNNKCAICKNELKTGKTTHVDHCHSSGKVRGILCTTCNTALGGFKDNIDILKSAVKYLKKYSSKSVEK